MLSTVIYWSLIYLYIIRFYIRPPTLTVSCDEVRLMHFIRWVVFLGRRLSSWLCLFRQFSDAGKSGSTPFGSPVSSIIMYRINFGEQLRPRTGELGSDLGGETRITVETGHIWPGALVLQHYCSLMYTKLHLSWTTFMKDSIESQTNRGFLSGTEENFDVRLYLILVTSHTLSM